MLIPDIGPQLYGGPGAGGDESAIQFGLGERHAELRLHVKRGPVAATYRVGDGSLADYRVDEVLLGQRATAVGRTSQVTGSLVISGNRVAAASSVVQMGSRHQRRSQHDD